MATTTLQRFFGSSDVPGPKKREFLASQKTFEVDRVGTFQSWHQAYGDIYRTWLGLFENFVFHHPDHIEQILIAETKNVQKDAITRDLDALLGRGLLTESRDKWFRNRKLAAPFFTPKHIRSYADDIVSLTATLAETWGDEVDVHEEMMQITVRVVLETLFGVEDHETAEMAVFLNRALDDFHQLYHTAWRLVPEQIPTPLRRRFVKLRAQLDEVILRVIRAKRRSADDDGLDLLGCLIRAVDDDGVGLSEQQLKDEAMTIFMAGHETVALALSYAWYLIAKYPDVGDRMHAEVDSVLGDRPATFDDLAELPFTTAVFKETMRLYPPAWVIGREPLVDIEVGGVTVPAGAQILMPQCVVHRDPRWFPRPDEFNPQRWMGDVEIPRFAYFPFGGGERVCIGDRFAQMEGVLVLATIAQRLRFECSEKTQLLIEPATTLRIDAPLLMKRTKKKR